jgi:hypothetical protein
MSCSGNNYMVVASMMMHDVHAWKRQRGHNVIMGSWLDWFENQAFVLRSVDGSFKWLMAQLSGDFEATSRKCVRSFCSEANLSHVGLKLPKITIGAVKEPMDPTEIANDDALIASMAHLALAMNGCRAKRCQYMLSGFSCRSILFIASDRTLAQLEIAAFKEDVEYFQKISVGDAMDARGSKEIANRSQFQLMPVEQLRLMLAETDWSDVMTTQQQARALCSASYILWIGCVEVRYMLPCPICMQRMFSSFDLYYLCHVSY